MYVRVGPFTADPTDSHVQARIAPQNPQAEALRRRIHQYRERQCGDSRPYLPAHPGCSGTQPA